MHNKKIFIKSLFSILLLMNFNSIYAEDDEVGKIENIIGEGEIFNGKETLPLKKEMLVHPSDTITTKEKALVKILFFDGADIILYEKSKIKIKEYKVNLDTEKKSLKSVFDDIKGKIRFFVKPDKTVNNDVKYKTSNAVMGVRGTGGFIVAPLDQATTQLVVTTGSVQLSNPAAPNIVQEVKENQWGKIEADKPPPPPEPVTPKLIEELHVELPENFDTPPPPPEEVVPDKPEVTPQETQPIVPPLIEGKSDSNIKEDSDEDEKDQNLNSKQPEEVKSDLKENKNNSFRFGPTVSFGVFNFFSIGIETQFFEFLELSANYGGISKFNLNNYPSISDKINNNRDNTPIQSTSASLQHFEVRAVIYPFRTSFFIGAALGNRHLDATINACEFTAGFGQFNSCVPLRAHLKIDTQYFAPQIGWQKIWESGFTLGTELGVQIPINSGNENYWTEILTNDSTQYNYIINSYAYQSFQNNIRDNVASYFRYKTLPFWNIIKIGWLF
ncbi:FecR family protein [Silvanigrella aquatica]|uniref:FecR protein domain-containing protein n=1 Tax=Silvanigrella aquatica TaxID=1915309 RepID=A0A1L4D2L4_9BACT|nr:FecR family protein [Silvanigrella aquatica]APJ04434.1 hypothetical protein AXG55_11155 [Silvanigrella aquatica]